MPVLKPCACAPITFRSMPPARPSKTCAEAVDEKVVADVVPAVPAHVVELDPAHDRRRTAPACSEFVPGGVVDDREVRRAARSAARAHDLLVRVPCRRARRSSASPPSRPRASGAVARPRSQTYQARRRRTSPRSRNAIRSRRPPSTGCRGASRPPRASRCRVSGESSPSGRPPPRAPAARQRSRPVERRARALPVQAEHVEPRRGAAAARACARRRAAASCARHRRAPAAQAAAGVQRERATERGAASHGVRGPSCRVLPAVKAEDPVRYNPYSRETAFLRASFSPLLASLVVVGALAARLRADGATRASSRPLRERRQPGHRRLPDRPDRPRERRADYDAVVIVLDTPGRPLDSMRKIVKRGARARRSR